MGVDLARLMQLIPGEEDKAARSAMVTGGVFNQVRHAHANAHADAGALALAPSVSRLLSTHCPHAPLSAAAPAFPPLLPFAFPLDPRPLSPLVGMARAAAAAPAAAASEWAPRASRLGAGVSSTDALRILALRA